MNDETKDARIERLLGLLGQVEETLEWVASGPRDTGHTVYAEFLLARIRMEREA